MDLRVPSDYVDGAVDVLIRGYGSKLSKFVANVRERSSWPCFPTIASNCLNLKVFEFGDHPFSGLSFALWENLFHIFFFYFCAREKQIVKSFIIEILE